MMQKPNVALLSQYFRGECSGEVAEAIEQWRRESPENDAEFQILCKVWESSADFAEVPTYDLEKGWLRLKEELHLDTQHPVPTPQLLQLPTRKAGINRFWPFVVAASLLLAASVWFWFGNRKNQSHIHRITAAGEQQQIEMADGSKVWLDGSSELIYAKEFNGKSRKVRLNGHAFFKVVPDQRTFVVETETAKVRVLGTSFDVWANNGKTRVVVKEGRVALKRRGGEKVVALGPDQFSECTLKEDPSMPAALNASQWLGWLQGDRYYQQQPLEDVILDLERVFGKAITLGDPSIGKKTLTATFGKESLEEILEELCLTLNMNYIEKEGSYFLNAGR